MSAWKKNGKQTELEKAIVKGDLSKVHRLLDELPDGVETRGSFDQTPIFTAIIHGDAPVTHMLLEEYNAQLNDVVDVHGITPLSYAARRGEVRLVQTLLEHKADATAYNQKFAGNPLITAAGSGAVDVVRLLLDANASANPREDALTRGMTPLHLACESGNQHCVSLLLQYSASLTAENVVGQRPFDVAVEADEFDMTALFLLKDPTLVYDGERIAKAKAKRKASLPNVSSYADDKDEVDWDAIDDTQLDMLTELPKRKRKKRRSAKSKGGDESESTEVSESTEEEEKSANEVKAEKEDRKTRRKGKAEK